MPGFLLSQVVAGQGRNVGRFTAPTMHTERDWRYVIIFTVMDLAEANFRRMRRLAIRVCNALIWAPAGLIAS